MIFCRFAMVGLMLMSLGIDLGKDGEPRTGRYRFGISLIAFAIQMLLLWGGGFFR